MVPLIVVNRKAVVLYVWILISDRVCKKIELTSSNSSLQEGLKITGQYVIQNSSITKTNKMETTYYNSEQNTYLLLSREEIEGIEVEGGIWMVRSFLASSIYIVFVYYSKFFHFIIPIPNKHVLDNTRPEIQGIRELQHKNGWWNNSSQSKLHQLRRSYKRPMQWWLVFSES